VAKQLGGAVSRLLTGFQERKLPVNLEKTGYLASSAELDEALQRCWALGPETRERSVRLLGVDAHDGSGRATVVTDARQHTAAQRGERLQILRAAGAEVGAVHRAGPTASAVWGSSVTGLAGGKLASLRRAAAKAEGVVKAGISVGLRLGTARGGHARDPLVVNAGLVARAWALGLWVARPTKGLMAAVWEALTDLVCEPAPWAQVVDPAAVYSLTLARIGIATESSTTVRLRDGSLLDVEHFSPRGFQDVVKAAAREAADVDALRHSCRGAGAWAWPIAWYPLRRMLDRTWADWSARSRGMLRLLICGGVWTQEMAFKR
jgi:hypothetical protein